VATMVTMTFVLPTSDYPGSSTSQEAAGGQGLDNIPKSQVGRADTSPRRIKDPIPRGSPERGRSSLTPKSWSQEGGAPPYPERAPSGGATPLQFSAALRDRSPWPFRHKASSVPQGAAETRSGDRRPCSTAEGPRWTADACGEPGFAIAVRRHRPFSPEQARGLKRSQDDDKQTHKHTRTTHIPPTHPHTNKQQQQKQTKTNNKQNLVAPPPPAQPPPPPRPAPHPP